MYCSTCGVSVVQGLSYCNHCGARLGERSDRPTEVRPELLVFGMVAALVFGLVAITFLMMAMRMVGLDVPQILALTILSFLLILMVEGTFIWQFLRRRRGGEETTPSKTRATQELDEAKARVLAEPVPSVTEHTTRAFDSVYRERT